MTDLTNTIFLDSDKARRHLEALRWPDGPYCPHCGQFETVKALPPNGSIGKGWYHCGDCRKKFTVRVGTIFERSHIPLHKWLLGFHLMAASKKGISAHQLHRMLGITYKSAWFMAHRIRESMREINPGPLGGENKVVEADETYIGGKAKNRKSRKVPPKEAVFSLVERDGKVRSFHVATVNTNTLRPILFTQVDRKSYLMTDEASVYKKPGQEFSGHGRVNHSIEEYVRGGFWHTNTVENYYSILKRGITGIYQHVSPKHLKRYVGEFDFRYNERSISDSERAAKAIKGAEGKRLTYQQPRRAQA